MDRVHAKLAGQIAARGFERYADTFRTQTTAERHALEDKILDSAIDEAEVAQFRDGWVWEENLRTWLQPA